MSELRDTIAVRRDDGLEPARAKVIRSTGKETMDRIRSIAATMHARERSLLEDRLANARAAERMLILVATICVILSIAGRVIAGLVKARMENAR